MEYCGGTERKCPVCGKEFYAIQEWAYRRKGVYFCSWGCLRKDEGRNPDRREKGSGIPITEAQKREVFERVLRGEHNRDIACEMRISLTPIHKIRRKMKEEGLL